MEFGARLRRIRMTQGISVREFARRVGVSGSYISQLESNECKPSYSVLKRIAEELGTTVSVLTEDRLPEEWVVVKASARRRLVTGFPGVEVELVTFLGQRDKSMQSCFVRMKPGSEAVDPVFSHEREDMIYVTKGTVIIYSDGQEYVLNEGDVGYFNFQSPEKFINPGPGDAAFFWVVSPSR
ncbi:MAG TPA: helix-turn-helix domain-containing protein [Firmicutes bacterium]|nr:helix-turn-helix domain-containing protein [Candidatus Fermentithermobacillaceae bacterium]